MKILYLDLGFSPYSDIYSVCDLKQVKLYLSDSYFLMYKIEVIRCTVLGSLSHVRLFATLWSIACQAPLSMGILQARVLEWVAMPSSK